LKYFSDEYRKKLSETAKGKHYYWLGKTIPMETRIKMRESHKGYIPTDETKRKISETKMKGKIIKTGSKCEAGESGLKSAKTREEFNRSNGKRSLMKIRIFGIPPIWV